MPKSSIRMMQDRHTATEGSDPPGVERRAPLTRPPAAAKKGLRWFPSPNIRSGGARLRSERAPSKAGFRSSEPAGSGSFGA